MIIRKLLENISKLFGFFKIPKSVEFNTCEKPKSSQGVCIILFLEFLFRQFWKAVSEYFQKNI